MRKTIMTMVLMGSVGAVAADADVISTFDNDAEGWSIVGGASGPIASVAGVSQGFVCAIDTDGQDGDWQWKAPAVYLDDISNAYGKSLTFELKSDTTGTTGNDVLIVGAGLTLVYRFYLPPGWGWTPYRIPLDETAGWTVEGLDTPPTHTEMFAVLSDVTEILIRGEFAGRSVDTGCLDNVRLELNAVEAVGRDVVSTFETGGDGWGAVSGADIPVTANAGVPLGYVCTTDVDGSDSLWYYKAPLEYLGDIRAGYGKALLFDLKTDQGGDVGADVVLMGANTELRYSFNSLARTGSSWTPYRIPLDENAGWRLTTTDQPATRDQLLAVMSSVTNFLIRGEFAGRSVDTGCLDNVLLEAEPTKLTLDDVFSDFDQDNEGWGVTAGSNGPVYAIANVPVGYLCADDADGQDSDWYWKAPQEYLGNLSAAFGGSLEFIQKTTHPETTDEMDILLAGNGIELVLDITDPGSDWAGTLVRLDASAGWTLRDSPFEEFATDEQIQLALSSLTDLLIRGEYHGRSQDRGCLDAVALRVNEEALVVQSAYVAYYGRPADPAGLDYWADRLRTTRSLAGIIQAFGYSEEFQSRYGNSTVEDLVANIYQQLLDRAPDPAGFAWYLEQYNSGAITLQTITLDVLNGAVVGDLVVIENKLQVAVHYTAQLRARNKEYDLDFILPVIQAVGSDAETVAGAIEMIDDVVR